MADKTFHSLTLPGTDPARVPDVAAEFNTGTSYAVRDYCTYQGILYRCTTAHAAGAWNASHFQATNLDNEFDDKLKIPPFQASAPANPRVGDLWIDNDEDSPILSIDPAPIAGSTNAVQSGGVRTLIDAVDVQKASRYLLTGDYSTSATYEKGQLVFWYPETFSTRHSYVVGESCVHNGVVYKCTTTHTGVWKAADFEAQHNASTDTLYRCIEDIKIPESWTTAHWQATNINTEISRLRESEADTDMIAENYGDSSFYAVGDYVVHNSDLFKCISAVSDTGSWTPNNWIQVALADDVRDLNSALGNIEDVVFTEVGNVQIFNKNTVDIKQLNVLSSKVIYNASKKSQCVCIPIAITAGDTFYVKSFISDSEILTDINGLKIFITNTFEIGDSIIEFGSSNYQLLQGNIEASSNANYLGIQFNFTTETNADTYIQKIINLLVVAKNTGTYPIEYVDYYTVNVVSATQDISDAGKVLTVDNNGKIVPRNVDVQDAVKNIEVMTLRYSVDIISSATITAQTGWFDNGDGSYTHTSGTSSLRCLLGSLTAETPYVVAYDITPYTEASVLVRFGANNVFADGYNGTSHCMVGFMTGTDVATTANKYIDFKPTATYAGTISNIHCYRIDELGTNEITLPFYDNVSLPLESNVTGFWNCVLSPDGMQRNVNGTRNTAAGYRSLASIISGNRNVALGSFALAALLAGERNIAIGSDAMYIATGGSDNVAIGKNAMIRGNDSLKENVGIGNTAMSYNNADAIRNVIIGFMAGYYAANKNVSVGYKAGYWTRGDENTSVGYQAGVNNFVTGNNNIAIGANTGIQTPVDASSANPATISNTIVIGNDIKAESDGQFVVGSQYTTDVIIVTNTGKRKIIFNNDGTITWETIS